MRKITKIAAYMIALILTVSVAVVNSTGESVLYCNTEEKKYIKWVDFNPTKTVLKQALDYDVDTYGQDIHLNWIELLAYAACRTGGTFSDKKCSYIDDAAKRLLNGEKMEDITADMDYYSYYLEVYTAVLSEFVGEYRENGEIKYGLVAYSPIAKYYEYSHYKDFGAKRTYGYTRPHLGNDLLGSIGTPIIAVEGGIVEALGWNQYGGWRVGIRSFDKKRYYYYAHLRKDHPYVKLLEEGDIVEAGDVIGYLGMTGYSTTENVNNINIPHLHFGMQLIFDESQKDGTNQIWIDVYSIVEFLKSNRSEVEWNEKTGDHQKKSA